MKKIYALIVLVSLFGSNNLKAAEGIFNLDGIVITDLNGESWDLGALQSEGKTIVLDFWATWCGPCINSIPYKNSIWNDFGPTQNGDSSIYFFSIENDPGTINEVQTINSNNQVNPVFKIDEISGLNANMFQYTGGIPYYVVVCPNGYWQDRTGGLGSTAPILNFAGDCAGLKSNDAFLYDISADYNVCPSEMTNSWQLDEVSFANLGTDPIESAKIFIKLDGIVVEIIDVNETIAPRDEYSFTPAPFDFYALAEQEVTVEIYSINGDSDLQLTGSTKNLFRGTHITTDSNIQLKVYTDPWPEETGFQIRTSNNAIVINESAGIFSGQQNTTVTENITISTPNDCHTIRITDSYGDGIVSGGFELIDASGNIIISNFQEFENVINDRFFFVSDSDNDGFNDVVEDLAGTNPNDLTDFPDASIQTIEDSNGNGFSDELMVSLGLDPNDPNADPLNPESVSSIRDIKNVAGINVYPSPTKSTITIEINELAGDNLTVEIFNLLGKKLHTSVMPTEKMVLNVSDFSNGMYLVNVLDNGKLISNSKFIVNK